MKKSILFLSTCLTSSILFANDIKLEGIINQIYDNNKSLLIDSVYGGQNSVKVLPNTKIEMDNCGIFGTDKDGKFKDLKEGDFVEIKIYYPHHLNSNSTQTQSVAKEIEVQCHKKAY